MISYRRPIFLLIIACFSLWSQVAILCEISPEESSARRLVGDLVESVKMHGQEGGARALSRVAGNDSKLAYLLSINSIPRLVEALKRINIQSSIKNEPLTQDQRAVILLAYYLYCEILAIIGNQVHRTPQELSDCLVTAASRSFLKAYEEVYGKDSPRYKELHEPRCPCCFGNFGYAVYSAFTKSIAWSVRHPSGVQLKTPTRKKIYKK